MYMNQEIGNYDLRTISHPVFGIIILIVLLGGIFLIKESFASSDYTSDENKNPILKDPRLQIELIQAGLDFPTQFTFI